MSNKYNLLTVKAVQLCMCMNYEGKAAFVAIDWDEGDEDEGLSVHHFLVVWVVITVEPMRIFWM